MCMRGTLVLPILLVMTACASEAQEGDAATTPDPIVELDSQTSPDTETEVPLPSDAISPDVDERGEDVTGPSDSITPEEGDSDEPDATSVELTPAMWTQAPLGDTGIISGLVALSIEEAYAVGGSKVLYFNGAVWSGFGDLGDVVLNGVWAGTDSVIVVGEAGFIARRQKSSTSWVIEDSGTQQHLRGIYGRGEGDVWVVGNEGTILHYAGEDVGWELTDQTSNIDLYGVWANPETSGAEGVVTCGSGGRLVLYYAGQWSTSHVAPGNVTLRSLYGYEDKLFAVGTDGTISVRQTETGSWVGQPSNMPDDNDLFAVAASGDNDIYAFGANGSVLEWLGTSWQTIFVGAQNYASSTYVAAAWAKGIGERPGRWLVVGEAGGGISSEDAEEWVDQVTQPSGGLTALSEDAQGQLWAVGRDGLLLMRQGASWSSVSTGTTEDLFGLAHQDDGTIWMVGAAGLVMSRSPEGVFTQHAVPAFTDLLTVHVDGEAVVVGGKGGALVRREGADQGFVPWVLGITQDVRDILQDEVGQLWLAGGFGSLYRVNGDEAALKISTGVSSSLNALARHGDRVIAVGDGGIVLEIGPQDEVIRRHEQSGLFLYGVASSSTQAVAVGWSGTALVFNDNDLIEEDTGTTQILEAVWFDGDDAVAVGRTGSVFLRQETP